MKLLRSILLLLTFQPSAWAGDPLHVEDAWVREAPPSAKVLAAYMHLHNMGQETATLTGASCEAVERVEIHQTIVEEGMARMVPQESLQIAPGEHINLEPGGYHLMLISPARRLSAGERVTIRLEFQDGTGQLVDTPVRKGGGGHEHHHHHH